MRKIAHADARLEAEFGIRVGRWTQYPGLGDLPFGAMWCRVEPGASSQPDRHPEVELAIVLGGTATYTVTTRTVTTRTADGTCTADGGTVQAEAGTAILLDPEEEHVIHNGSPDEPLTILSLYWLPGTLPGGGDATLAGGPDGTLPGGGDVD